MAETTKNPEPTNRIIMWGMARSLSTVFEKCVSFVDGIQIINEPFQCASMVGPEGLMGKAQQQQGTDIAEFVKKAGLEEQMKESLRAASGGTADGGWDDNLCTYQWVKDMLEGDFPEKKLVFSKDLITGIHGKYEYIPKGYQHTFIIRNPIKVSISQRKLIDKMLPDAPAIQYDQNPIFQMYPGFGFGEMVQLIEHLQESSDIKGEPIIIDADHLQNHPDSIVSQYCQKTGIPLQ